MRPGRRRSCSTARGRTSASAPSTGRSSRSSAGSRPASRSLVIVVQNPATRWVGLGWIAPGFVFYVVYRRRFVREPLDRDGEGAARVRACARARVPAPARARAARAGPRTRRSTSPPSLAAERGAQITAVYVIEIPLDLPLVAELPAEEELANRELDEARAIGESYGVTVIPRLVRARSAGAAIVREAERRAPRSSSSARRGRTWPSRRARLRPHRRLRAQERALPRARDGDDGGRGVNALPRRGRRAGGHLRRDRRRAARRHGRGRRRRARLPARRRSSSRSASAG